MNNASIHSHKIPLLPPPTTPFFFILRQTLNEVWIGRLNYNKSFTYRLFIYK